MWLESLVACAGVTFSVVATAMGIGFRSAQAVVKGKGSGEGGGWKHPLSWHLVGHPGV